MHKKVLVVDDNKVDRYLAEVVMGRLSFAKNVVCVESAGAALDYLSAQEGIPENLPEIIFLDINMPVMNGFDFLEEYDKLSETIKKTCIIMMLTTSLNEGDMVKARSNQYVRSFLNKPLSKEKIENLDSYLWK